MARPGLIDRQGLLDWAKLRVAESELPRLIRRLILETGRGIAYLGFPAGEGVAASSWDGTVRATEEALYIPLGLSLWEVSVNGSPGAKANDDYQKRTTTPDGSPTSDCAYVEVILRPWTQRFDWARDRTAEGRWKKVTALGVDDVETWLEFAPITHAWLSELNGLHPYGLVTAQTWWNTWSAATTPAFPSAVVVAGRDEAITKLRQALGEPGQVVTVRGTSRDEVAAFVAAVVLAEEAADGGALLARTAFIDNVETWRRLRGHQTPLVLVALTEQVAAEFVPSSPHVLIVPRTGTASADIELRPIDAQVATEILKGAGLAERQAVEAGQLARLSLLAARRRLANKRELLQPAWAESPAGKTIRRLALVGRWNEDSDADRALVGQVAGILYDTLREEIAKLSAGGDPLLARVGGTIGVVSPIDAWLLLFGELRQDDLVAVHDAARTVLAEIDPRLDLPRDDRWLARVRGKTRAYSDNLRQGLATTLALLGAYGARPIGGTASVGRDWAARIVRETLAAANADAACRLWVSLADVLPLLAEAAPEAFLDAVATGACGQAPVLSGIFEDVADSGHPLGPSSAHSYLLWALERCAWSPDHIGRVGDALARLAEIDRGGRLSNRPFACLHSLFRPWYPQTAVSAERRLAVIDGLRDRHPAIAWKLLMSLLPEPGGAAVDTSEPQFRDWKPEQIMVSAAEYWTAIGEIWTRLLADAGHDPDRWVALIEKIDDLPPPNRGAALARLDALSGDGDLSEEQRTATWRALRAEAAKHREYATVSWALPADEVSAMEATATRFAPTSSDERHRWLFEQQSPMISTIRQTDDFAAYDAELMKLRATAAAEIADTSDWSGLQRFATSLEHSWLVGEAVARARRYEHESEVLTLLGSVEHREAVFAAGYVSVRFQTDGWEWLESYLNDGTLSPNQVARLLLYTDDYPKAWQVAETMGEPIAALFWQQFRTHGHDPGFAHVDFVAERLLDVNRPGAALDLILIYSDRGKVMSQARAKLVARGLEALLDRDAQEADLGYLSHDTIVELFSALERSELSRERLARLEWAYLPSLNYDGRPATLTAMLPRDPDFFVDIIRRIFKPSGSEDTDEPEPVDEAQDKAQREAITQNAYRLLMEWKNIPGQCDDGTVDAAALDAWVTRTRVPSSGSLATSRLATRASATYWPGAQRMRTGPVRASRYAIYWRSSRAPATLNMA
ncbi:MAG: hypothetical protein OJF49_001057 [Ktedonobacterales bacterium]|nr:MAG: hypothetical protein OJF49_001057 [Ktedonobacterales bacterium]